ncbi:WbqC family protein [Achromobacter denitrificans]
MKLAIMQPYFFPYIGYYQLIAAVDLFVVYDNIKYTKKGWINRNRMLQNGKDVVFSLPLKAASDFLHVDQRELSADFRRDKLLAQFEGAYRRSPFFKQVFPLLEEIINFDDPNLFSYLYNAISKTCAFLDIKTKLVKSSEVDIDHDLKAQEKVIALSKAVGADTYINAIGGTELYDRAEFRGQGIDLSFLKAKPFEYAQFDSDFVPWLSIIDVMMFNGSETLSTTVRQGYELV